MKKQDFKYKLVAILWIDAETSHGWEHVAEDSDVDALATSVGFLYKETTNYYKLASTYSNGFTNNRISIPKGMVKEIKIIK